MTLSKKRMVVRGFPVSAERKSFPRKDTTLYRPLHPGSIILVKDGYSEITEAEAEFFMDQFARTLLESAYLALDDERAEK